MRRESRMLVSIYICFIPSQEFMLGMCVALDQAIERADILPARLQYVLWGNVGSA